MHSEDWDWADAQADLSLCLAHTHFVGFVMSRLSYNVTIRNRLAIQWNGQQNEPHHAKIVSSEIFDQV